MLADSNLIIYAASGKHPALLNWFLSNNIFVSAVSLVETLGYHALKPAEKKALETIFNELTILYPSPEIFHMAVELRQQHSMSVSDALIAATALQRQLTFATHNVKDFEWIKSLTVVDPLVA